MKNEKKKNFTVGFVMKKYFGYILITSKAHGTSSFTVMREYFYMCFFLHSTGLHINSFF